MTITEFLLARIAEDEQRAHAAAEQNAVMYRTPTQPDPRLLRECEAKRRLIELAGETQQAWNEEYGHSGPVTGTEEWRILAAIYQDHPDYDPAWADTR